MVVVVIRYCRIVTDFAVVGIHFIIDILLSLKRSMLVFVHRLFVY